MKTDNCLIPADNNIERRKFIVTITKATGIAFFITTPFPEIAKAFHLQKRTWTVEQVIGLFIKEVPGSPFKNTVDTLKAGQPGTIVTGIVTTMFATIEVIKKTIQLGANFIIAHEPSFYNHQDETDWLKNDDVYQYKMDLLNKHNIAIWRNHDYIHNLPNDGVLMGVLRQTGWNKYNNADSPHILILPSVSLKSLVHHLKERLNINMVRYIGDLSQPCQKILLMPGAAGGRRQIEAIMKEKPDVLVCGEIQEWETAEYVRDARAKGQKIALVVLGHIASEEPGSEFMADWIKAKIPGMRVTHIHANNSLNAG
ncbi:MAG TPA: Nif3-like dinuclear metal center hexameric protein [Flavisolibacter sp.]|nr:Nif3-like dinuclear metal center hexameric protein [Flavisolibacter sp.]